MPVRPHNDLDRQRQGQGQGQGHETYLSQSGGLRPLIILTGQGQVKVKVKVKVKGRQVHFLTYLRQSRGLRAKSIFLSYLGQGQSQGQRSRSSIASMTHTRPTVVHY